MYVPIHLHTEYSVLDGLNKPSEYVDRAKELGITHLSQTDHGTLAGHREFQRACEAGGIKPILGLEAYISSTDRFDRRANAKRSDGTSVYNHITLLAADQNGLQNLSKMSELAWTEGYYYKPRIDLEVLKQFSEGIIVASGCLNGLIAKAIEAGDIERAELIANELHEHFGDKFFIEVQSHNPAEMNHALLSIADKLNIAPVMASDCHYAKPEDLWAQEAMLILSTKPTQNKEATWQDEMDLLERFNYLYPDRKMSFQELNLYLRSYQEEVEAFSRQGIDREDIFKNTLVIADMVGEYAMHSGLDLLPSPKGDPDAQLKSMCIQGLRERNCDTEVYRKRMNMELEVIHNKNFSSYFLIVSDMVSWAKGEGILVGPGRGSAAGSLVNYLLGITDIDPIQHNLLFARFINEERNDNPDIDVDIMDSRRSEVKDYLSNKFRHVASISTFAYFKDNGAIRDASRVIGVPLADVNRVLKTVDTYEEFLVSKETEWFRKKYPDVLKVADYLRGRIRGVGMHPAGVVVSREPIEKYAPIETREDKNDKVSGRVPVIAYDMVEAEALGFIKIDALGLKTLSVINDALAMIKDNSGVEISLQEIDMEDYSVYQELSMGFTKGVFQAEAAPYTSLLTKMGVSNFDQLVASNALVRPGAMNTVGGDYIARKNFEQPVMKLHPIYDEITEETYGLPIYQEQVMLLCNQLAGMSWSDADKIRKIIGKKKDVSEFEQYHEMFVGGASKYINKELAEKLWHDFEAHSNYSFNKSHAVAYSTLTYWTAWLKYYYPLEFMCAVLKNENDTESLTDYLIEAKRLGLKVFLPHINTSESNFSIHNGGILFGLSNVKYISNKIASRIIALRPFDSYENVLEKVGEKGSGVNSRAIDALNRVGGVSFKDNPRRGDENEYLYEYLNIPSFNSDAIDESMRRSLSTIMEFDEAGTFIFFAMVKSIKRGDGWSRVEIVDSTGSIGVFHNEKTQIDPGRMYLIMVSNNRIMRYIDSSEIVDMAGDPMVRYMRAPEINVAPEQFVVLAFSSRKTKKGTNMASVVLCNKDKRLTGALVFDRNFFVAVDKLKPGSVVSLDLSSLNDGTQFVRTIN